MRFARTGGIALFLVSFCLYISYHGTFGERGWLKRQALESQLESSEITVERLRHARQQLALRVAGIGGDDIDPDLLDELVRQELGMARTDEFVILLDAKNN